MVRDLGLQELSPLATYPEFSLMCALIDVEHSPLEACGKVNDRFTTTPSILLEF